MYILSQLRFTKCCSRKAFKKRTERTNDNNGKLKKKVSKCGKQTLLRPKIALFRCQKRPKMAVLSEVLPNLINAKQPMECYIKC